MEQEKAPGEPEWSGWHRLVLWAACAWCLAGCGGGAGGERLRQDAAQAVPAAPAAHRLAVAAPPADAASEPEPAPALAPAPTPEPTLQPRRAPIVGVNIHAGGANAVDRQKIADVMSSRHLMTARMDFTADTDLAAFRDQVLRLKEKGIEAETSLQISHQWDHSCSQDLAAVEQRAHDETVTLVHRVMDIVHDFELLNEVSLRPEAAAQVLPYQATPAAGYAEKPCYATLAAVLKGMGNAVLEQRTATGQPLRAILGAVSNDFGFLDFMQQQGVAFDIVGYHAYPWRTHALLAGDPWYGAGGALAQLARFNKPVRINEFNCGEIYATDYENLAGAPVTVACLASIQKHLTSLMAQNVIDLESIHAYEITDRPAQPPPENRFGLMFDLDTPKLHLALYSAFAGGDVSAAEWRQLTALGLAGPGPTIGVNIHRSGGHVMANQKLADVMSQRRLMSARMELTPDTDLADFRDQVQRLKARGIRTEVSLQTSYQWDRSCNQDLAAVTQDAYAQTAAMVRSVMDLVQVFELLNEVSLRPDTAAQVPPYRGSPALAYAGQPCYATLAAVLRGMSQAVVDQRTASGLPLRIALGAVSNDFGFLDFMQQQGVVFDIVGYRSFPRLSNALLSEDPWYGEGGALAQLARFDKPLRISAFNCGEISSPTYAYSMDNADAIACLGSIRKHLSSLLAQTTIHLVAVHAYEIIDRPAQAAPGDRFGLMFDLDHPKLHLALYSVFSGGYVSDAEWRQLNALGLAGP